MGVGSHVSTTHGLSPHLAKWPMKTHHHKTMPDTTHRCKLLHHDDLLVMLVQIFKVLNIYFWPDVLDSSSERGKKANSQLTTLFLFILVKVNCDHHKDDDPSCSHYWRNHHGVSYAKALQCLKNVCVSHIFLEICLFLWARKTVQTQPRMRHTTYTLGVLRLVKTGVHCIFPL